MAIRLLYIWFFLSGFSALVYEIAWSKMLVRLFGASLYAVATVSSVFLAGLAIGALISGWRTNAARSQDNTGQNHLVKSIKTYALLELAICVFGFFLPWALDSAVLEHLFVNLQSSAGNAPLSVLIRVLFASVLLLPPTILMGATLPVLVDGADDRAKPGFALQSAELLYAANTTGAVAGVLFGGFYLLPSFGLSTTCMVAAGVNGLVAVLALASSSLASGASSGSGAAAPDSQCPAEPVQSHSNNSSKSKKVGAETRLSWSNGLIAAFVAGFLALMLQVSCIRWFQLLLGSSTYSISSVLAVFLLGLAAGAWLVSRILRRLKQPLLLLSCAGALSALYLIVILYAADEMPWLFLLLSRSLESGLGAGSLFASIAARFFLIALNVLVPAVCMGVFVPLLFDCVVNEQRSAAARVGIIYAVNTCGTIFGALLAGFVLIPGLSGLTGSGIQATVLLVVFGQVLFCGWLFFVWSRAFIDDGETRMIANGVVTFVAVAILGDLFFCQPSWNKSIMSCGAMFYIPEDVRKMDRDAFLLSLGIRPGHSTDKGRLFYREGLNTTVSVEGHEKANIICLRNNGKVEAALPADISRPADGTDINTHALLGSLPVLLHKGECHKVLAIGYGSGTTAGVLASFPEVERLKVAELEPSVLDAAKYFNQSNGDALRAGWQKSGRSQIVENDGRYILLTSPDVYDAIVSQPAEPWVSGASELFTREFWQLARRRLAENGVFCQWIQLYSMPPESFKTLCRTFLQVFPNSVLVHNERAAECILVGFKNEFNSDESVITRRLQDDTDQTLLKAAGISDARSILGSIRLNADGLKRICTLQGESAVFPRENTDDNLAIEYAASNAAMVRRQNIDENINSIRQALGH